MEPTPFVQIARVVKTHGTAGELAVASFGGALDELPHGLEVWFVPPPDRPRRATLTGVRAGPKGPLMALAGVDNLDEARALAGTFLLARRSDLPEDWLPEQGLDPIGLTVTDVDRGPIGTVVDTIATGANDVWVVAGGNVGEVLIPVIDEVILSVDEEHRSVQVRLLPGLLDEA